MKTIKYINTFAVSLPFVILLSYPFIEEGALIFSLLSTMATGFLQVMIAFKMLYDGKCDSKIYIYFAGVTLFFILWYSFPNTNYTFLIFSLPLILAIYLSILVYSEKQNVTE
ncbi:hypothetical protein [Flavobacterium hungaricum]|uniref:SPW repeat-containing protein n=1 Tax=Flavobacterium hungaricum TaxID=2082725 RepID=A0ABR9TQW1_9FLAO|nr:hypothetical protein [Flavobacterium hungaricum]MBE8727671.1 hypothetical protein [Flavobacterium hungaricum]